MRTAILSAPLIAFMLNSCSTAVGLAITNLSLGPVMIESSGFKWRLAPNESRETYEWPEDRIVVIKNERCTRSFNLDEGYTPAVEWRLSTTRLYRRYIVDEKGFLHIDMPDQPRSASAHLQVPIQLPPSLDLTPTNINCPD
jgi:hypothetical protein